MKKVVRGAALQIALTALNRLDMTGLI